MVDKIKITRTIVFQYTVIPYTEVIEETKESEQAIGLYGTLAMIRAAPTDQVTMSVEFEEIEDG